MPKIAPTAFLVMAFAFCNSIQAQIAIEELDKSAAFSFSIMSDNKGYSIENAHMFKCDSWIKAAGDKFILGLGDHVKDNRPNPFFYLIKHDRFWHNHFYPNVADGENEYWGADQSDWGAGYPILDSVNLSIRENVIIRDNQCEYYALEMYAGIKVHIIQLHYSDSPPNPDVAFNESSRKYLMNILNNINKTDNDIIVVLAHTGAWVNMLREDRKLKLMQKADLILGATTHKFQRYKFLEEEVDTVAIAFNTGAVGNSSDSGFIQVHVLKNPTRMIIQYQKTKNESREIQGEGFAFEKVINGKIKKIDWSTFSTIF